MPRITYHDRFAALLAKDYVSDRDRSFAESLYEHYKRKGSLTAGRRRCFVQMEERYAVAPTPAAGLEEATTLYARVAVAAPGSWDARFINSIVGQLSAGREISQRQTEILDRIKDNYSDEAMEQRAGWATSWDEEKAEIYRVALGYYKSAGYFGGQVAQLQADPQYVPTLDEYRKVTDNKFARKVLAGWLGEAKFAPGTMVALGAGATYAQAQQCPTGLCVVIQTNATIPTSAARGCKVYKLLPVGGVSTFLAEERQLKRARTPKKKKK